MCLFQNWRCNSQTRWAHNSRQQKREAQCYGRLKVNITSLLTFFCSSFLKIQGLRREHKSFPGTAQSWVIPILSFIALERVHIAASGSVHLLQPSLSFSGLESQPSLSVVHTRSKVRVDGTNGSHPSKRFVGTKLGEGQIKMDSVPR